MDAGQSQEPPGESPVLMPAAPPLGGAAQPCEPTQPFEATQEDTQEDTQEYVATQEDMQGSSDMQQLGEEEDHVQARVLPHGRRVRKIEPRVQQREERILSRPAIRDGGESF